MDSKDIGSCLLNNTDDRNTLFSLSMVCKSYSRAFDEFKPQILKRYDIDIDEYEMYRVYNIKLKKDKMQQKEADKKLKKILVKFFNRASQEQRKHTSVTYITAAKCNYPKTLNIRSKYINKLIEKVLVSYSNKNGFKCSKKEYDYDTKYYIKKNSKLVYKIVLTDYSDIFFINVQLFERYIVHFITKIIKRNKRSGKINLRGLRWVRGLRWDCYTDLIPKKISNNWKTKKGWNFYHYVKFTYKPHISHQSHQSH